MPSNCKTVLITGAAGGIGGALSVEFREAGYLVIATDKVDQPTDLESDSYVKADLNRYANDETYADSVNSEILRVSNNRLDLLINNAAVQVTGGVDTLTRADWHVSLNVNLIAAFLLAQAFLKNLEVTSGSVINVGSIHARLTKRNFVAYATSKAALSGLTRAMSIDLGSQVRVNSIEPAAIETDMLLDGFKGLPKRYKELASYHPVNRIGKPEEVAKVALWLASDECKFIHGACIGLDGGISNCLHDPST